MSHELDGSRILIIEDEFMAALDLGQMIEDMGGTVVGPAGKVDQALDLARSQELDGAVLDVNLNGDTSFAVADALADRGIPFIFATGYALDMLPRRFAQVPRLAKPFSEGAVARSLARVIAEHRPS